MPMPEIDERFVRPGRFRSTRFPGVIGGGLDNTIAGAPATSSPATTPTAGLRAASIPRPDSTNQDGDPDATPADEPGGFTGNSTGAAAMGAVMSAMGLGVPAAVISLGRGFANVFGQEAPAAEAAGIGVSPGSGQGPGVGAASTAEDVGGDTGPGAAGPDVGEAGTAEDVGADVGPGGDGGGGGGSCFMTTALNDAGDWSDSQKRIAVDWCRRTHHDGSKRGETWVSGYHLMGGALARLMRRSRLLRRVIRPMMEAFTAHATGRKRSVFGFVVKNLIADPIFYAIGVARSLWKGIRHAAK